MKVRIACLDHELLWVIDDEIGGLYSIDRRTLETECAIDFLKLFQQGRFEAQFLLKWKEDYIIVIPREIDKSWIFYNKTTREMRCRKVIERKCQARLAVADQNRNQLYFFPLYLHDPVIIVELETLNCSQIIENWSGSKICNYSETAWTGAYDGQFIFISIKGSKTLVRMECGTQKVDLLELDIPEGLSGVDYAYGELWTLPVSGNKIYQIDSDGQVINTLEIVSQEDWDLSCGFARIIIWKKYLFLLPCYRRGIYIYDKLERKTHIISENNLELTEKDEETYVRYWECCVGDHQIYFLPLLEKYMEIDLNTLAFKTKELSYPDMWTAKEKIWKCIWNHTSGENLTIGEAGDCDLGVFLKYIKYKTGKEDFFKIGREGRITWDMLRK